MKNIWTRRGGTRGYYKFMCILQSPPFPLIKSKHSDKLYKEFVRVKYCWDLTSETFYLREFKMTLFENVNMEEFFVVHS